MVPPQARRSKRRVLGSSDDENDGKSIQTTIHSTRNNEESSLQNTTSPSAENVLPSRLKTTRNVIGTSQSLAASPTSTPESTPKKPKSKASKGKSTKKKDSEPPNNRTLHSFFNAATQRQQQEQGDQDVAKAIAVKELEDVIHDDSSEEEDLIEHTSSKEANLTVPKKRSIEGPPHHGTLTASQKFLKTKEGLRATPTLVDADALDLRPWTEKYAPGSLDELVVHKRKVADVRLWIENALNGDKYKKLLVLKGAAGSGKTTTVNILSKTVGFGILQWQNPVNVDHSSEGFVSIAAQFNDFLGRGRNFSSLELLPSHSIRDEHQIHEGYDENANSRQILLVEEFPANLNRSTTAAQVFRSTVLEYLAGTRASGQAGPSPLIMVISESVLSNSTTSVDNFTAHRVLGPEILSHPSVTTIEFNPVAPTFIMKALNLVLRKRERDAHVQYAHNAEVLKKLAEFGDVRNAVSTLEFLSLQTADGSSSRLSSLSKTKSKSNAKARPSNTDANHDPSTQAALSLISLRESTIGLFHAVGKVVYNKRTHTSATQSAVIEIVSESPQAPTHFGLNMTSEVDTDRLIDETGTDVSTFLAALHENYLLSCYSSNGNSEVTFASIDGCLEALAEADILCGSYGTNFNYNLAVNESIRQSDFAFQVGVQGILHSLPYPVKRQAPNGRSRADAFKMFYPMSLKLWRRKEEIEGMTDLLAGKTYDGSLATSLQNLRKSLSVSHIVSQPGRMHSIPSKRYLNTAANNDPQHEEHSSKTMATNEISKGSDDHAQYISLGSGHSARHELLLERLPYVAQFLAGKNQLMESHLFQQIQQVTQFTGVGVPQDEEELDEAAVADNSQRTSAPSNKASQGQTKTNPQKKWRSAHENELGVEKLVLSDDDIEDD